MENLQYLRPLEPGDTLDAADAGDHGRGRQCPQVIIVLWTAQARANTKGIDSKICFKGHPAQGKGSIADESSRGRRRGQQKR